MGQDVFRAAICIAVSCLAHPQSLPHRSHRMAVNAARYIHTPAGRRQTGRRQRAGTGPFMVQHGPIHVPFMVHSWCNNLCPQHLLVVVKNVPLSIENVWIAVYQRLFISLWYQRQEEASADSQTVSFTTVRLSSSPDHATSNLLTLLTSRLSHAGTKCCGLAARLRPTHQVDQSAWYQEPEAS